MSITGIKNKYLRRTVLVLAIPILLPFGVIGVAIYSALETIMELPDAIYNAWHGRGD